MDRTIRSMPFFDPKLKHTSPHKIMLILRYLLIVVASSTVVVSCAKAADEETAQVVNIQGMSNPDLRSYRNVVAGLDAFDEYHHLAPLAPQVRFRLAIQPGKVDTYSEPLQLHIVGKGDPILLPIEADGKFTVPRIAQAYDDNADLMLNRKKKLFRAKVDVRTPDLPPNVRRLGDLRLECEVMVAIAKEEIPFLVKAMVNTVLLTTHWCGHQKMNYGIDGIAGLGVATLVSGDRKLALRVEKDRFYAPLGDPSWPDDALIDMQSAAP